MHEEAGEAALASGLAIPFLHRHHDDAWRPIPRYQLRLTLGALDELGQASLALATVQASACVGRVIGHGPAPQSDYRDYIGL